MRVHSASLRPYDYLGGDYYSQEGPTVLEEHKIGFIGENVAFMDPLRYVYTLIHCRTPTLTCGIAAVNSG